MNAIEIRGLTRRFGARTAVDNLTADIAAGTTFALLGLNGAGKTTTIRMLAGLLTPTAGDAFLDGHSVVHDTVRAKQVINLSPQETAVAPNLTVLENLEFIAGLYGMRRTQARDRARQMLDTFGLSDRARDRAQTLSGGMQRRLSIAMALVSQPKILFLDEPTLGLDILARRELWAAVEALKGKVTIILTTHYLEEAEALADEIGIMAGGRLLAAGSARTLMEKTGAKSFEDAFVALAAGKEAQ